MNRTRTARRLSIGALGLAIAVGASLTGIAPAQAAGPDTAAAQAATVTLPAPSVYYETYYYISDSSIHLFTETQMDPSIEQVRFEYQLDGAGQWLTLSDAPAFDGFASIEDYALAPPGDHLISLRTSAVVDGVRITSPATAPSLQNARGYAKDYTPSYVVDGPDVTFSWDVRDAQNGWPTEDNVAYTLEDGEYTRTSPVGEVTVPAGYGQTIHFTFFYGGGADFQRYVELTVYTPAAPGSLPLTSAPAPAIQGRALVGETLSVRTGAWQPAPVQLTYQWLSDGTPIQDATDPTLLVSRFEAGTRITVVVRGSRTGYVAETRTSAPTPRVPQPVIETRNVSISGAAAVGRTLTAHTAAWGPGAVELEYNWSRDGEFILDAYSSTYHLTEADRGHVISVRVAGEKTYYPFAFRSSTGRRIE